MRFTSRHLDGLSVIDQAAYLASWEQAGEELAGRGLTAEARSHGQRMIRRAQQLRDELFGPPQEPAVLSQAEQNIANFLTEACPGADHIHVRRRGGPWHEVKPKEAK